MNSLRTIGGAAGELSVAYSEPPVSPPVSRPMASVPTPAPVHTATPMTPVASAAPSREPAAPAVAPAAAAPAPEPQVPVQPAAVDQTVAVFVYLKSGEKIWAGRFDSPDLAEQRASEVVRALLRPEPGVWAKFGNRLIRPSAVVSIELASRRED